MICVVLLCLEALFLYKWSLLSQYFANVVILKTLNVWNFFNLYSVLHIQYTERQKKVYIFGMPTFYSFHMTEV